MLPTWSKILRRRYECKPAAEVQNVYYSYAVEFFRNTTIPTLCNGAISLPDGTENPCNNKLGHLVCNSNKTLSARMSNPAFTAMEVPKNQGMPSA